MADGSLADFEAVVHPDAVNHEAKDEPPASRGKGPAAFHATALWLRETFADLAFQVHQVIADGDLVAVHNTMSGRHVGPAVTYDPEGRVRRAFPPTGRTFATTQTHWFRLRDGKVVEHWANRDDLGTATQLGWVPPTPRTCCAPPWPPARPAAPPRARDRNAGAAGWVAGCLDGRPRAAVPTVHAAAGRGNATSRICDE